MFRSTRLEMLELSQKVEHTYDLHMTLAPRVASNERQTTDMQKKLEGLEARLDRELQRRRLQADSPPPQMGQLPPPAQPQAEAIDDWPRAQNRITLEALSLDVPDSMLQAYQALTPHSGTAIARLNLFEEVAKSQQ